MRFAHVLSTAAALGFGAACPATWGQALPAADFSCSGTCSASYFPSPQVVSTASSGGFSYGTLSYYFQVAGPTNTSAVINVAGMLQSAETFSGPAVAYFYGSLPKYDTFVLLSIGTAPYYTGTPLLFAGIGSGGLRGTNGADTGPQIGYTGTPVTTTSINANQTFASQSTTLNIASTLTVSTNTTYLVQLMANLGGNYNTPGQLVSTSSGMADPTITLDPTFAAANSGYSVLVSAGVGNAAPVPESSTLAMLAAGLLVVGRLGARQKLGTRSS